MGGRVFQALKFRSMRPDAEAATGPLQARAERCAHYARRTDHAGNGHGRTAAALEHPLGRHELCRTSRAAAWRN